MCYKFFKHAKDTEKKFHEIIEMQKQQVTDTAEVITKLMLYLEKEFGANFENQKKTQQWLEKNFDVVASNASKAYNGVEQSQRFLQRMSEALGITQRSNLQDLS